MSEIQELIQEIQVLLKERGWEKAQKPKDLAISLSLEAAEVLEHFQWKTEAECRKHCREHKEDLADELADVMVYLLELAHKTDIDVVEAVKSKLVKVRKKYPAKIMLEKGDAAYQQLKKKTRAQR